MAVAVAVAEVAEVASTLGCCLVWFGFGQSLLLFGLCFVSHPHPHPSLPTLARTFSSSVRRAVDMWGGLARCGVGVVLSLAEPPRVYFFNFE